VTAIDIVPALVDEISDNLDVQDMLGYASYPDVLERAGARDTGPIIAVTHHDEVNMVERQAAHSLFEVPRKIEKMFSVSLEFF
jgi:trk system potassium uptake protein TrkA